MFSIGVISFCYLISCSHGPPVFFFFFFNVTATTEIYTLSLHDALPISRASGILAPGTLVLLFPDWRRHPAPERSEEHTSELQSHSDLVCRLLLEKKKTRLLLATKTQSTQ